MIKYFSILFLFCLTMCLADAQNSNHRKFYLSFPEKETIEDSRSLLTEGIAMTEDEAMTFVYFSDNSRLFCDQEIVNMETERKEGLIRETLIPNKCFLTRTKNSLLVGYTEYKCNGLRDLITQRVITKTIDPKTFKVIDSLIIHEGNEYDWSTTSLINLKNGKIASFKQSGVNESKIDLTLLRVTSESNFEREKSFTDVKGVDDNLAKSLARLGLKDLFESSN